LVKHELHKGGGKLIQCIAKWDKLFLSVQWESASDGKLSFPTLDDFLRFQVKEWSEFWAPSSGEQKHEVLAADLAAFRKFAL
jgi:hypothetical protein